ncbi:hypothetical protein Tco_0615505 [Tanacetum coccineum]
MLAPGNYVQGKSRIKRYIDTKPNHELIHFCLKNPPYKFQYRVPPNIDGTPPQPREEVMKTYATVSEETKKWIDAEAEAVQIFLTRIDNDNYSTVDACPNAMEMWKAIKRLKQEWKRFMTLVKQREELRNVSYHKLYDIFKQYQNEFNEIRVETVAHTVNPLALVAQQQPVYYPQQTPTQYTLSSLT